MDDPDLYQRRRQTFLSVFLAGIAALGLLFVFTILTGGFLLYILAVLAVVVGAAGLRSTLAAARAGKRLLLANKESLAMAGPLLLAAVRAGGSEILPIDSEHNAIFQCLPHGASAGVAPKGVRRILLTASGGPFRDWTAQAIAASSRV